MIQKIVKNSDIKFCVDDDSKIQDKFIIKFYTIDKAKGITRTADDVITVNEKRYIKLNWSTIKLLDNGMLNYEVNNLDSDADYDDGVYNSTFTRTTYYYLCTDSDGLADVIEEIELRVDQNTTDITDLKSNNSTLKTQTEDLQNRMTSVETKSTSNEDNITGLQNRMTSVETKSTNNENSINTMSTDYAALVSRLEKLEANGTNKPDSLDDRVTALENSKKSLLSRLEEAERIQALLAANYPSDMFAYELENKFTPLYNRVSALENGTQGSNESTSSLATNNDNIVNRASALENEPSSLATNNDNIVNRASALENEPSSLATNNDSISNRVSALENNYQRFDNKMSTVVEKFLKDFVERFPLWSQANDFDIIASTLEMRVSALERGTQGNNESISSAATNNDNIVNRASALATNNDSIVNRASAVENEPSALATNNDSISNRVSALANSTEDFESRIDYLYGWVYIFNDRWTEDYNWHYFFDDCITLNKRITALETR